MVARVPLAPDQLYQLLIDPVECLRIFRSLKRVRHRRVLADDGKGNRTVEVRRSGTCAPACMCLTSAHAMHWK